MTPRRFDVLAPSTRILIVVSMAAGAFVLWPFIPPLAFTLGFGAAAFCVYRHQLTLDPAGRSYTVIRGVLPFAKPLTGPFDDLLAVSIESKDNMGRRGYYRTYPVNLEWQRGPAKPYPLSDDTDFEQAAALTAEIAALAGIPVLESSLLALLRAAKPDVPYTKYLAAKP